MPHLVAFMSFSSRLSFDGLLFFLYITPQNAMSCNKWHDIRQLTHQAERAARGKDYCTTEEHITQIEKLIKELKDGSKKDNNTGEA